MYFLYCAISSKDYADALRGLRQLMLFLTPPYFYLLSELTSAVSNGFIVTIFQQLFVNQFTPNADSLGAGANEFSGIFKLIPPTAANLTCGSGAFMAFNVGQTINCAPTKIAVRALSASNTELTANSTSVPYL